MSISGFTKHAWRLYLGLVKQSRRFSSNNGKHKLSYYHERGTSTFKQSTFGDLVDEAAEDSGDVIGISFPFQNIQKTYYQFKEETDQLAAGLVSLGLTLGDRIAIYGPNSYQWLLTQYAASKAGLILVSINPASTEKELANCLQWTECKAIVMAESFRNMEYYNILCSAVPEIPESRPGQIKSQRLKNLQKVIIMTNKDYTGAYRLEEVMKADDSAARRMLSETRKKIQFDSPTGIMFTSGTTGNPKGVTASHFQVVNQATPFIKRTGLDKENPVICLQVPLFHGFGNAMGFIVTVQCRGKCVIPSEHFHPVLSLEAIEKERCTFVYGVPLMFNELLKILRRKKYDIQHWKTVVVGASPVPLELTKALREEFGLNVLVAYGTTEACSAITTQSPLDFHKTIGSAGKPIEFTEVKIVDKDGNIVPVNTNGEVLSRSPFTFCGYWKDPQKTAEALDSARWYHTGDVGRMDEEGNVYITGRIKEMVIRGGVNIFPSEIENFLVTHPSIEDVYVVGVPDERYGEELCASVKLKEGCVATEDEIKEFCQDKISHFKIPRYVVFCKSFPKTGIEKVMKHKLREECIERLKL